MKERLGKFEVKRKRGENNAFIVLYIRQRTNDLGL